MTFADRTPLCLLSSDFVSRLSEDSLVKLARDFYNDTYLMDQNACSSARAMIWLGKKKSEGAQAKFWDALESYIKTRYELGKR